MTWSLILAQRGRDARAALWAYELEQEKKQEKKP